jgi:hypothetical protein
MRSNVFLVWVLLVFSSLVSAGCLAGGAANDDDNNADVSGQWTGQDGVDQNCVPDCSGKICGSDGCGSYCGQCFGDTGCVEGACVPCSCEGLVCGPGACGENCGACAPNEPYCYEGACQVDCPSACESKQCGPDGCGASCGSCGGIHDACEDGQCVCQPSCDGKKCGSDGCGGDCGLCGSGEICTNGGCEACTCAAKQCGDNGCGVLCGICKDAEKPYCNENQCSEICAPDCQGKLCGDDGCGGLCGQCPNDQDICLEGECLCQPNCDGNTCGSDGCGGSCGVCGGNTYCFKGECAPCGCIGKVCGDDGCGTSCGTCPDSVPWCHWGSCFETCQPDCEDKLCGDDGCGGSCGSCDNSQSACIEGYCLCSADCVGQNCGDDGCGHFCGGCEAGSVCDADQCVPCTCEGQVCGANACGESCGECSGETPFCFQGLCSEQCIPDCSFRSCGSDGCGGSCGECLEESDVCVEGVCLCQAECSGKTCGADGCGGICGLCEIGYCLGGNCQDCACGEAVCGLDPCGQTCGSCGAGQICSQGSCIEVEEPTSNCGGPCTGASIEGMLCAMEVCYPDNFMSADMKSPTGDQIDGAWEALAHYGDLANDLDPRSGDSYAVLATGDLDPSGGHQDNLFGGEVFPDVYDPALPGMHDSVELEVKMIAPPGTVGFSIDTLFLSKEFKPSSFYNDKFYILLNASFSTGGVTKIINHTPCIDPSSYFEEEKDGKLWCHVSPHTAFQEVCPVVDTDVSGTGFTCEDSASSTGWMRTSWPVFAGEVFTLTFHLHDGTDGAYDSAAILDNFQWLTEGATSPGTVKLP